MLTADVAVPEPAGVSLGMDHDGAGIIGEALEHHRLPVRRPCLRCTVCLVTPDARRSAARTTPAPGRIDLEDLQPFGELPERRHGAEPGLRVGAGRTLGDLEYWFHGRQHMLNSGTSTC